MSKALAEEDTEVTILSLKAEKLPTDEVIDGIQIKRLDCGNLIDRINRYNNLNEDERQAHVKELFNKNDIEDTALKLAQGLNSFIDEFEPTAIHFHNSYFIAPYALYFLKQIF